MSLIDKYLPHIEKLMEQESITEFATQVYNDALALSNGTTTTEDVLSSGFLNIDEADSDEEKIAKTSINHIKQRICL